MATFGVFGLNMSPKSGGVYSLIDGLMSHAHHSRHRFLYLTASRASAEGLPPNVELVARPPLARVATQLAMNVPGADWALRLRALSSAFLSAAGGVKPRTFGSADGWLWPHCFKPVPNLRRTVVICHDMIHRHHPNYFSRRDLAGRRRAERMLTHTAGILCPSHASADDLLCAYPNLRSRTRVFAESPCEIVRDEECSAEIRRVEETYGDVPLFLFVAVDWPHKNHELLIDAALALRAISPRPFRVVFVGRRRGTAVADAVRRKLAGDVVTELGGVSRAMLAALYKRAAALVYPSLHEGFGIPLVEAMRYGVPIIASNRPCIPEVTDGAAELLPPDAPQVWAREMHRLLADPAWRAHLAERSRDRAAAFGWERTWHGVDDALDAALAHAPAQDARVSAPAALPEVGWTTASAVTSAPGA